MICVTGAGGTVGREVVKQLELAKVPFRVTYFSKDKAYSVYTRPIPLPHVPGVQGNFYKLTPFEVTTDQGGKRGDFGVHWDGNIPGSAGCIVMTKRRFDVFQEEMEKLEEQDIFEIPLFVTYS